VILKSKAKEAGIEEVSPYDLGRTFITSLFEAGTDIMFVAALGGHVSLRTTRQYDNNRREREEGSVANSLALSSREARRN